MINAGVNAVLPDPPSVAVPHASSSPVTHINPVEMVNVGQRLHALFTQYVSDRRIAELRWLANQRQYLGIYDPEIEKEMNANRSKAYPRVTRVKCISVLSRIMNLMFQGNERNWELRAAPWPDITPEEVAEAMEAALKKDQDAGQQPDIGIEYCLTAIKNYADARAEKLSELIDDQLQELGGDQSSDYVGLNRRVLQSGILYGLGVLRGPFVRKGETVKWEMQGQTPVPKKAPFYKPVFEFLPIWDFYPDMSAKNFAQMDGYFIRMVMSRAQVRKLVDKPGFMEDQLRSFLRMFPQGNYRPQPFETELRAMGVKVNVNEMKAETMKYELRVWHGALSGEYLRSCGVEVAEDKLADDLDAEIWMAEANVVCARLNPWKELDVDMSMIHTFMFDEDDTSPIGFGLPNAIRDSQMMVAAATRMLLDNASVVCGPQLELNTDLLRLDQDLTSVGAYKVWYREGEGIDAQWPAVRNVTIDAHLEPLMKIIELGLKFADAETFVGPATGGDMAQAPSEPMRTAAGASMMRGDAALPFKDMIRAFDSFTQSVIHSLIQFNRKFNPDLAPDGDYDVIARGATSLMAKEMRGMQADQLATTLTPDEQVEVDGRKLLKVRLQSRDMEDIMVSEDESARRRAQQAQTQSEQQDMEKQAQQAEIRKTLSDAFRNIASGQQHSANADSASVKTALDLLQQGIDNGLVEGTGTPGSPAAIAAAPKSGGNGAAGGAANATGGA